ncbi:hypothetical protein I350_08299 [Cryptococcus amylolentus CBS 6273]|uniref:Uncharacterized protein n=1 Tax=Cryptococcus amylolentus CBS 6273 TaxID=1296118 RepID=A0A1E3J601_9TREE|nr:hypothetical protein I350_08299 [Cryptococcus amylolentus CBS 6273]
MCIHDWVLQIPKDQPRTKSLHPVVATATATNSLSPRGSHAPDEDYSVDGKEDNVAEGHHEAVHEDLGYHDADATLLRLLHCTQSINSIKLNVAAVVTLWESQRSLGINNYDTPRDKNINANLRALSKVENARKVLRHVDRHFDGIATKENMKQPFRSYLIRDTFAGIRDCAAPTIGMPKVFSRILHLREGS